MVKHTLDALRARTESLRTEWRELPKRRDSALFTGDKDALLDTQIRERQIPYEYLLAVKERLATLATHLQSELEKAAKRRAQVRAQLVRALPKLEAAWREVDALQQEYLRLLENETELPLWSVIRGTYTLPIAHAPVNRTAELRRDLGVVQQGMQELDTLLQRVAEGDANTLDTVRRALEGGDEQLPRGVANAIFVERDYAR
jgi:chromosome segregation ATPase